MSTKLLIACLLVLVIIHFFIVAYAYIISDKLIVDFIFDRFVFSRIRVEFWPLKGTSCFVPMPILVWDM